MKVSEVIDDLKVGQEIWIKTKVTGLDYGASLPLMVGEGEWLLGNDEISLTEPKNEKVEVPDYVAEWIEYAKKKGHTIIESANPWVLYGAEWSKADIWIKDNQDTFARAFLDGYTVKPKRWVVKRSDGDYVNDYQEATLCVGIGLTPELDVLPPYKFTDKAKAEAVATLVEGSVEEI